MKQYSKDLTFWSKIARYESTEADNKLINDFYITVIDLVRVAPGSVPQLVKMLGYEDHEKFLKDSQAAFKRLAEKVGKTKSLQVKTKKLFSELVTKRRFEEAGVDFKKTVIVKNSSEKEATYKVYSCTEKDLQAYDQQKAEVKAKYQAEYREVLKDLNSEFKSVKKEKFAGYKCKVIDDKKITIEGMKIEQFPPFFKDVIVKLRKAKANAFNQEKEKYSVDSFIFPLKCDSLPVENKK